MNYKIYINNNIINKMEIYTNKYAPMENGGLLFGRMNPTWVSIYKIYDLPINTYRTRSGIIFRNDYLEKITAMNIKNDLFIVGTWHSHPENSGCTPSLQDLKTMKHLKSFYPEGFYPVFCISILKKENLEYNFYTLNSHFEIEKIKQLITCKL